MTPLEAECILDALGKTGKLYYCALLPLCDGDIPAALVLQQALYWTLHNPASPARSVAQDERKAGWFYKSDREWFDELGLTGRQMARVRKKYKRLLETKLKGTPATLHYRLTDTFRTAALRTAALQILPNVQTSSTEMCKLDCTERPNQCVPHVQTSAAETAKPYKEAETTAEITAETTNDDETMIRDALARYGTPDRNALRRIFRECRAKVPDITADEIASFIHGKGATATGENIHNPLGLLLTIVPDSISPEAVDTLRRRRAQEQEEQAAEERRRAEEQAGRERERNVPEEEQRKRRLEKARQMLADPSTPGHHRTVLKDMIQNDEQALARN